jgi:hypothetical protein
MAVNFIDGNAYTLQEYELNSNDPWISTTAMYMIDAGSLWRDQAIITNPTLKISGTRITGNLPAPTWNEINAGQNIVKPGSPEWFQEGFYKFSDGFQVSNYYLRDHNMITDPFEQASKEFLKGVTYDLNYKFIQNKHEGVAGDPRVNPQAFVGIRERLDHPELYFCNPSCNLNATANFGGINLGTSGTGADGIEMSFAIQRLFYFMGSADGAGITLTMNGLCKASWERAIKKSGSGAGFRLDKDEYGRTIEYFQEAKIIDCGRQAPTGPVANRFQAPIISETENVTGTVDTGGTYTSVYAFKNGAEHLYIWQFDPLKPGEPYLLPDGYTWQLNFNGGYGLSNPDVFALGRLSGIGL